MPAPLDPEVREAIETAIREGTSRNAIARTHGVSGSTVTKIAKTLEANGAPPAFDRANTKRALEARKVDLDASRADLAEKLLGDAHRLREKQWEDQYGVYVVPVKGGGATTEVVPVPASAADHRNYMTAVGIAVDKVRVLVEKADDTTRAANLLERLMEHVDAQ